MAQAAKNIALEGIYGIQTAPGEFYTNNFWITTGYPVVFPTALFLKIFGASIWAARLTPLIYLVSLAAVSYFFIKKLYGFAPALLAGLLLITFPPFYGNGKALLGEVPGLFWLVLGGLLYLLYEEKKQSRFFYLTALAWGLTLATKPYFVLMVPGIALFILFLWLKKGDIDYKRVMAFCFFFAVPILVWAFFAFDFSSLPTLKATLIYFLNSYGAASFEPLKNLFRFVSESTPIHFTVLALAVFASSFISLKNKNLRLISAPFLIFIIFAFLWYLKTPGWYRYFFPAHVILILFFPAALTNIMSRFSAIAILSALIIFQAAFLFLNYNDSHGDDVLKLQAYAEDNLRGESAVFIDSLPEAGFVLTSENLYQRIFISERFEIGTKPADFNADYLIIGRSDEVGSDYDLTREIGHYRLYRQK